MASVEEKLFRLVRAANLLHGAQVTAELLPLAAEQARLVMDARAAIICLQADLPWPTVPAASALPESLRSSETQLLRLARQLLQTDMTGSSLVRILDPTSLQQLPGFTRLPAALATVAEALGPTLVAPLCAEAGAVVGILIVAGSADTNFAEAEQSVFIQLAICIAQAVATKAALTQATQVAALYQTPFQNAGCGLFVLNAEAQLQVINAAYAQLLRRRQDLLIGCDWLAQLHPSDLEQARLGLHSMLDATADALTLQHRYLVEGHVIWARDHLVARRDLRDGSTQIFGFSEDISAHVQLEQALHQAKESVDQILSSISDAFFNLDNASNFTYVNDAAEVLLGKQRAELLNVCIWDAFPEAKGSLFEQQYRHAKRANEAVTFVERYEPMAAWIEVRGYPHVEGFSVYFRDVTKRIEAEREEREQQSRLELALNRAKRITDITQDVLMLADADGYIMEVSDRCKSVLGYEPAELVGRRYMEFVYEEDLTRTSKQAQLLNLELELESFQNRYVHKDGHLVHLLWSAHWVAEEGIYYAFARDISHLVAIEEKLRQAQRLEAVGQLTGGVAHDFNNLLTVIMGGTDILLEELPPDHRLRVIAEMTRSAAVRGADLTRGLLAFSRRQALSPKVTDVNRLVANMDPLLRRTLDADVEIELVRAGGLWHAMVDRSHLESAILNLCINARDAMPQGGRLTIETANVHLDDRYADMHDEVKSGQYVMVAVSDTGDGMSPESMARAFEPFYTTKEVGKGSGLGLSMVYGFSKQSGGHVKIYSERGHGTVVKLYLPRALDAPDDVQPTEQRPSLRGVEQILVVEDDDLVRAHVEDQLRSLGYSVVAVGNGAQALDVLTRFGRFDLLFTDVVMPGGMNGRQLAEAAWQLFPDMPVLFTSGYTENAIVHHGRLDRGVQLLNKPYRRQDLAAKVRAVLKEGGTRPPDAEGVD